MTFVVMDNGIIHIIYVTIYILPRRLITFIVRLVFDRLLLVLEDVIRMDISVPIISVFYLFIFYGMYLHLKVKFSPRL